MYPVIIDHKLREESTNEARNLKYKLKKNFKITAQTDDGEIMGIEHVTLPIFGIQFHPESILTPQGPILISNFLRGTRW